MYKVTSFSFINVDPLTEVERLGAHNLSCNSTEISCTRTDTKECLRGIGLQVKRLEHSTVDMRGRYMLYAWQVHIFAASERDRRHNLS